MVLLGFLFLCVCEGLIQNGGGGGLVLVGALTNIQGLRQ